MSSFNKNLLVAGFLAMVLLIIASLRATADCNEWPTGIKCKYNDMCVANCLQRAGGYTGGYCSINFLYCVCTRPCAAQSMTTAPVENNGGVSRMMGMAD